MPASINAIGMIAVEVNGMSICRYDTAAFGNNPLVLQ